VTSFAIRYDPWFRWTAGVAGLVARWSRVTIDGDRVVVRMSYAFSSTVDRAAIRSATPWAGRVWGWGVHGWRGRWLVNGSSHGILVLAIDPPARARVLGVPVRVRELAISLDDPAGFTAALGFVPATQPG
jgi:hypothetical protein